MSQALQFLQRDKLQTLLDLLQDGGYRCIGPQVRDHTIVFDEINDIEQLPQGIIEQQAPGNYRLVQTDSTFYFQWTTGPQAIKPAVFAPRENLWSAVKTAQRHQDCLDWGTRLRYCGTLHPGQTLPA